MRRILSFVFVCLIAFVTPALATPVSVDDAVSERVLGDPDAPVTIVEFSSLTCPHCAKFHRETFPDLKEKYIDTGKVRLVFKDFPFDRVAAMGAVLARCAPTDRYFKFLDVLFKRQDNWTQASDPAQALAQIGRMGGIGQEAFDACIGNEKILDAVLENRLTGMQDYKVQATPTFIVNGEDRIEGAQPLEKFEEVINGHLNE